MGLLVALWLLTAASAQATHPRPKSASPTHMSLVPAYATCTAPNRTHGPPLALASCNPPTQTSEQATVGTPDAFGGAANATGYLRLKAWESLPGGPTEADIRIELALSDVRCVPAGGRCGTANASGPADYTGEMRFLSAVRLTDHWNATAPGGGTDPATVEDFTTDQVQLGPFGSALVWPCVQSGSTSTGSSCSVNTSLNAINPDVGVVRAHKRGIWELNAVRIYDGGADGDGDTTADNTVFARPGIFIP
jgi:hypothetical protein